MKSHLRMFKKKEKLKPLILNLKNEETIYNFIAYD